jgi:hypothetical protein
MSSTLPRPLSPIPPSPVTGITFNQHLPSEDEEEDIVSEMNGCRRKGERERREDVCMDGDG